MQGELFPGPDQVAETPVTDERTAAIAAAGDRRNRDRGYDPNIRDGYGTAGEPLASGDADPGVRSYEPLPPLEGQDPGITSGEGCMGIPAKGSEAGRAMARGIDIARRALEG